MAPVEKGDTIFVSSLDGADKKVEWVEKFLSKSAEYEVLAFEVQKKASTNTAPTEADEKTGVLFVEKSKLQEFKGKATKPDFTFVVTTDFQYGQAKKDGTNRWLAFHDRNHKIFQHRFFEKWNIPATAGDVLKKVNLDGLTVSAEQLKRLVGNYLHNFE